MILQNEMKDVLHITNGDCAGGLLEKAGLGGKVLVWRDLLYDGPRCPGWPDEEGLSARAEFLERTTGCGVKRSTILESLQNQYRMLEKAVTCRIVLWFDACLCDQSMLVHILTCLWYLEARDVELLCIDSFPGIEPFNGLGQLSSDQLAGQYETRQPVSEVQFKFAVEADRAFAVQDFDALAELAEQSDAPLPWISAAAARWLQECPDPETGLSRLDELALAAICSGNETPREIFEAVAAADTPPQYWGDTTLWAKINALADCEPPFVEIDGPAARLPLWKSEFPLSNFTIRALSRSRNAATV